MATVIARVTKISAQTQYGERRIEVDFPGDNLWTIEMPDTCVVSGEEEKLEFNTEGIRHLVRSVVTVLYIDADKEDFSD